MSRDHRCPNGSCWSNALSKRTLRGLTPASRARMCKSPSPKGRAPRSSGILEKLNGSRKRRKGEDAFQSAKNIKIRYGSAHETQTPARRMTAVPRWRASFDLVLHLPLGMVARPDRKTAELHCSRHFQEYLTCRGIRSDDCTVDTA